MPLDDLARMHTEDELDRFAAWERDAWEQRAGAYAASLGDLTRGSISLLLDAAGVGPGTRLLDVGTGPGFVALAAVSRGAEVTAVDQSEAMVTLAREAGLTSYPASVDDLPEPDGTFDAVTASYLLNHLARPELAVAELHRVLRPGGVLALTVWDAPEANRVTGLLGEVVTDLGLTAVVPAGPASTRFADEAQLRSLLEGWADVRVVRPTWPVTVDPARWFDAIEQATPRTGAVLAQAGPAARAGARERYVAEATRRYGTGADRVTLPAASVLAVATRP